MHKIIQQTAMKNPKSFIFITSAIVAMFLFVALALIMSLFLLQVVNLKVSGNLESCETYIVNEYSFMPLEPIFIFMTKILYTIGISSGLMK